MNPEKEKIGKLINFVDSITEKKRWYIIQFLFYFLLTFVLFSKYIADDMLVLSGDGCGYINIFEYAKSCVNNGTLPLWNPLMNGGKPFITDLSNTVLYPFRILFSFLPTKWFFYAFYSFHLAFGATFFTMYLREIKCTKFISIFMSFAYYFSICLGGYRKSHLLIVVCSVYLPVVLYLIEKYYNTNQAKFLYFSSLVLAFQFLVGFPQNALYTDLFAGVYLIVMEIRNRLPFWKWFKQAVTWGLLYIGFALIQIIPFGEMYMTYSQAGALEATLDYFSSFSTHPIKLAMMFCPTIFCSDPNSSISYLGLSELQIEIFIGTIAFSLIIYAIVSLMKDFRVWTSLAFMLGIFVYAMNGEFVSLARFFYSIPLLGSFRCASRVLFIFTFLGTVIASYSLSELIKKKDYKRFLIILSTELCVLIIVMLSNLSSSSLIGADQVVYQEIWNRYKKTCFVLLIAVFGIYLINQIAKKNKSVQAGTIVLCVSLIVYDIYPYWAMSSTYSVKELGVNNNIEQFLTDHSDEGKYLLANPYIDGGYQSAISFSANMSLDYATINSYTAMNNPLLSKLFTSESILSPSYNYSGLYTGFPEIRKNIMKDNDMLSMLGVKYIIDQENIVPGGEYINGNVLGVSQNLLAEDEIDLVPTEGIGVYSYPIDIKSNQNYRISFEYNGSSISADQIIIDFYGNDEYDTAEQQTGIILNPNQNYYEYIFNSGTIPNSVETVLVRVMTQDITENILFTNFRVDKIEYEQQENPYKLVLEEGNVKIYENLNSRDILYCSDQVKTISDENEIYGHNEDFDFDDISYIEAAESFDTAPAEITNVSFNGNRISASVIASGRGFLNFSQAYYPGWEAYIDGRRVTLYKVNGYIQGIELPEGEHEIIFKYVPVSLYIGAAFSAITFVVWWLLCFRKKAEPDINSKKSESETK